MRIRINVAITTEDGTLLDELPLIIDTINRAQAAWLVVEQLSNTFETFEEDE